MKYAVIEVENDTLVYDHHPSGLALTDGDSDVIIQINRIGVFDSKEKAWHKITEYLDTLETLINENAGLKPGWKVQRDCDDYELALFKLELCEDGEGNTFYDLIDYGGWVVKLGVVPIPDKGEKPPEKYGACLLDFAKEWWE